MDRRLVDNIFLGIGRGEAFETNLQPPVVFRRFHDHMIARCFALPTTHTTSTFVAHAIDSAVICGFANFPFLPEKSASTTPRAVAQALQT